MIKLLKRYCVSLVKNHELARFAIVAGIASIINYATYYTLLKLLDVPYNLAFTAGYAVSYIFNFFASNYFTFRTSPSLKKGLKFAVSHFINYVIGLGVLNILVWAGVPQVIAPIAVVVIVFPIHFFFIRTSLKGFTFKRKPKKVVVAEYVAEEQEA